MPRGERSMSHALRRAIHMRLQVHFVLDHGGTVGGGDLCALNHAADLALSALAPADMARYMEWAKPHIEQAKRELASANLSEFFREVFGLGTRGDA